MPRVSVITIVKDHEIGLKNTYESLLSQTLLDWEMIVVVADSTDGTFTLARTLQSVDSRIRLIRQKGRGIYEAMNEGLGLAIGIYTWFMNAGDKFASGEILEKGVEEITKGDFGLVIGSHQLQGSTKDFRDRYLTRNVTAINFAFNRGGGCHQAMIFRTDILKKIGGFNVTYSLASDFDLVIRVLKVSQATKVLEIYADIEPGGIADQKIYQVHYEKHQIRRRLLGGAHISFASLVWTFLARAKIASRSIIN